MTVTVVLPALLRCFASPSYAAVIVCVREPRAPVVYVTEQLAESPLPASVQLMGAKVPLPFELKLTVRADLGRRDEA